MVGSKILFYVVSHSERRSLMGWKSAIRNMPLVGRLSYIIWPSPKGQKLAFESSSQYWEERYRRGGNSGAGSYNRLAAFKAEVLNRFVEDNHTQTIIEFGCGDGAQLKLARYPSYVGVDVSETVLGLTRAKFASVDTYRFIHTSQVAAEPTADLTLSLDVIYHLVEDEAFNGYMRDLFAKSHRHVIVYSSNEEKDWTSPHVRHRRFADWVERNAPEFRLKQHIPNSYPFDPADPDNTSFADFFIFERA
jgi:hypothetical protein